MISWTCVELPLGQLSIYKNNPRKITEAKFKKLQESLDELGVFKPFILDFDQATLLGGNQRSRALLEKFPINHRVLCMVPDRELSEEERQKVVLLDNGSYGEFDYDILGNTFDIDLIKDLDLDIKIPDIEIGEVNPLEDEDIPEEKIKTKFLLEVQLPNELDLRDLYDDLISKGYIARDISK